MSTMKARTRLVADIIHREIMTRIADKANDEGWDGRELVTGLATAYADMCAELRITEIQAIHLMRMSERREGMDSGTSKIISPYGRPLAKVG